MKKLKVFDGTQINYELIKSKAKKPTLVFIHPWVNNLTVWDEEVRFLKQKGYTTLRYDIRGHGMSDEPLKKSAYSLVNLTKELGSIIKQLKLGNVILIAHSFGGMMTTEYYFRNKEKVGKIIFIDSVFSNPIKSKLLKKATFFLEYITNKIVKNKKPRHCKKTEEFNFSKKHKNHLICDMEQFISTPFYSTLETAEMVFNTNLKGKIKNIKIPILVIQGDSDKLVPIKKQKELFKGMGNVMFRKVKYGKHNLITEHPEEISKLIYEFIKDSC